jgi:glutathione-regulated potassium-efflux system protein KefB
MPAEHHGLDLLPVIALLAAAVIAAPLFKRLRLGSVLGYLAAGIAIGPYGLRLLTEPASLLQVAELGVVMFLFVIGLEMRPSRLWSMRGEIFGLGLVQVAVCAVLLTAIGVGTGFPVAPSFVAGVGFVLTSTAIVMQMLEERRSLGSPGGRRIVSILLLEDLMIVPLLVLVAFLAPIAPGHPARGEGIDWAALGIGVASIAGLLAAASRWRWGRSSPGCSSPNRPSATSSKPTSSPFAACCSGFSSSRWACRSSSTSWWPTGA